MGDKHKNSNSLKQRYRSNENFFFKFALLGLILLLKSY